MSRAMGRNREDLEAGCTELLPGRRTIPCFVSSIVAVMFIVLNAHLLSDIPIWLILGILGLAAFMLGYGNCQMGPREAELIGNVEEGLHVGRARQNLPSLRIRLALMDRDFDDLDYKDLRALDDDITQDPPSTGEGAYNARYMVQSHVHTRRIQGNELACIVCLEQFSVGELIRSLPCLHQGGDLRYCQKCSHYKPPRAHHCRVCKRCVLRMDHHCVWINNCVGHANYKVFLVFMLYAVIACIHSMVLLLGSAAHDVHRDQQQNGGSLRTPYIICGVLLIPLTLALSVLLGWHIYLISHNKTTIEYHEGVRAMWLAEKVGNIYRHPYDLGVYENLVSVLGLNIFCWICPIVRNNGSGLGFRTSYDGTFPTTPR